MCCAYNMYIYENESIKLRYNLQMSFHHSVHLLHALGELVHQLEPRRRFCSAHA